jgi:hypothetical protein
MTQSYLPKDGFLSPCSARAMEHIHEQYEPWFSLAASMSDFAMEVLPLLKPGTSNNQQLVAATLFGHALTSFQSAYILVERGLVGDARTIVRASMETVIVLCALVGDE